MSNRSGGFVRFLTGISGAVIGYIIASLLKERRIDGGGYKALQDTHFTLGIIAAYVGTAMAVAIYAKWRFTPALFLGCAMFVIAIIWSM